MILHQQMAQLADETDSFVPPEQSRRINRWTADTRTHISEV